MANFYAQMKFRADLLFESVENVVAHHSVFDVQAERSSLKRVNGENIINSKIIQIIISAVTK